MSIKIKIFIIIFCLAGYSESFSQIVNLLDSLKYRMDNSTGKERIELMTVYGGIYIGYIKDTGLSILHSAVQESINNECYDCLVNAYIELANTFSSEGLNDSASYYSGKALMISRQINNDILIGKSYSMLGSINLAKNNYKLSYFYLMKADSILSLNIPSKEYCENTINISRILFRLKEFESAISYILKGINIAEKNNYQSTKADLYNRLAYIYKNRKDNNNTLIYLNEAIKTSRIINHNRGIADAYKYYGDFHTDNTGNLDEARNYYEKSFQLYLDLGFKSYASAMLTKLSHIYMLENNLQKALEYSMQSLRFRKESGRNELIGSSLINIGSTYYQMKNYYSATKYLLEGLEIVNGIEYKSRGYEILYKTYLAKNNYKSALENYQIYVSLTDSIKKNESFNLVSQIELKYELEKQIYEIDKMKYDLQRKKYTYTIIFSAGLLIAIIVTTIAFLAKRKLNKRLERINIENEKIIEERTAELKKEISTRKKAEEDLKEAIKKEKYINELKSRFVSMISHEFRTPLTGIETSTDLLKINLEKEHHSSKNNKYIKRINNELNRLSTLLNDVLLLGRNESSKIKFNPLETDLIPLIKNLIEYLKRNNRNFIPPEEIEVSGVPRKIICDQQMMETIFTNLFMNANKYSRGIAKWNIKVQYTDKYYEIYISDNGIGIPENEIQFLFESFFRGSNTAGIPGTGIGLFTVKQMVDEHKGKISVKNNKGRGVTFNITIPYQ
ncbi:MAG: tetratricopeptide repeat protein [Ignavibacteria bacterium]|nr:tetratricopeptide repeat protein [Ignavibacteria bacterium]